MESRRVGIYGGTFDPVHNGHIKSARKVCELFALDELIFVPAYVPPHKKRADVTSAFHRFAMLVLATEGDPRWQVSTIELDDPGRPYAVETVERIKSQAGQDRRLFFLMGADSWSEISSWKDWQRLLNICDQIVVTRPGYELKATTANVVDVRGKSAAEIKVALDETDAPRAFFTDAVMVDIKATEVRAAARSAQHEWLRERVPAAIVSYIEKYSVYK
jgi:nicotinate-nucleotide adenylyltransferase